MPVATLTNTAALVYVADLVAAALNAHEFGEGVAFKAERSYADWDLKLEDAGELHVDVVPMGHPTAILRSRGSVTYRVTVNIGLRKRFTQQESEQQTGRIDLAEVDRMVQLLEQIHELMCGWDKRSLADNVAWQESGITDSYVAEHLRQHRQYTGLILLTYHVTKTLEAPAS
jgi:hypothetical protein